MANVYVVDNNEGSVVELSNLGKVAAYLGEKKITKADIEAGKYPMVTIMDATKEESTTPTLQELQEEGVLEVISVGDAPTGPLEVVEEEPTIEAVAEEPTTEEVEEPVAEEDPKKAFTLKSIEEAIASTPEDNEALFSELCDLEDVIHEDEVPTPKQVDLLTSILTGTFDPNPPVVVGEEPVQASDTEYPEVGDFKDEKAMKKFIKGLSNESLQEWCMLEGAEWKPNDHESINRMRMAMAIKAKHFPQLAKSGGKKSKSKYASYSTEELVSMAMENDVEVPDDKGDTRILRMYTIMALRKAGMID